MILYEVLPNKTLKPLEDENTYITENLISSVHIKLPSTFGDYPVKELTAELRFYFPEGNYMAYAVDTQQARPEVPITNDITEKPQTLSVMLFFYKNGNVIGKTNSADKVILDAPLKGEPLTPREEFDEVIAEQRETIAEQAETITEQVETISSQGEQITELSGEVTELTTENTRLEALTETQRETIQNMLDNPPQFHLQNKLVNPTSNTQLIEADEGYDGLASVSVTGTSYMNIDLQKWISPSPDDEPFEMIFEEKVRAYVAYGQVKMVKATVLTVTIIEDHAFSFCSGLQSVVLPASLQIIGSYAFRNCSSLTEMTLPNSLTSIGSYAFQNCSSLTEINLPDSLPSIGYSAFQNCSSLTEINLPDSLTSIGGYAFQNCSSLTNLTLAQGFNCNGLNVSDSIRFTAETIVACLEALADRTGQKVYTITFGTTNLNKLTAEQKAIATNKNWNLA